MAPLNFFIEFRVKFKPTIIKKHSIQYRKVHFQYIAVIYLATCFKCTLCGFSYNCMYISESHYRINFCNAAEALHIFALQISVKAINFFFFENLGIFSEFEIFNFTCMRYEKSVTFEIYLSEKAYILRQLYKNPT